MADLSLGEFLAQAQRGMGGGYFGRVSGPLPGYVFGPDFFRKATYLQISDTFIATYGKKVWDALNNRTVAFNAIKKVDWGPTVGWRLRTDRGSNRSRPVTETGALPTIDVSAYTGIYSYPRNVVTVFGVSLKGQAVSALEGGIGNQFAVEQEAASRDHVKEINQELVGGAAFRISAYTVGDPSMTTIGGKHFRKGDTLYIYDTSANAYLVGVADNPTVNYFDAATNKLYIDLATTGTPAAGDVISTKTRNGVTTIDDVVAEDDSVVTVETNNGLAKPKAYSLTTRTAATYAAGAYVSYNGGTGRDVTLAMLDTCFEKIRQNGGEPKLIITGLDQYDNINQLLQAQQRFVDVTDYIVGVGDERTYPGTRAGFQLATYRGIPILPDPDCPKSINISNAELGSNVYVLDTDYLELAVMYPTQYIENRDYFAANALVMRGMFLTMVECRSLRFDVHAKLCDLNT